MAEERCNTVRQALIKRLEEHDANRQLVQDELHNFCDELRKQVKELEDNINKELEGKFSAEDDRLQVALSKLTSSISMNNYSDNVEALDDALSKARSVLLVKQSYALVKQEWTNGDLSIADLCKLDTKREADLGWLELKKPENLSVAKIAAGRVYVTFDFLSPEEEGALTESNLGSTISKVALLIDNNGLSEECDVKADESAKNAYYFLPTPLCPEVAYTLSVKSFCGAKGGEWSNSTTFTTPKFSELCTWKECPESAYDYNGYDLRKDNPRVATKRKYGYCTVIGSSAFPPSTVTSLDIKILKSQLNNGTSIYIGVAPSDIDQNEGYENYLNCGWYFYCYYSALYSGFPHSCKGKKYGPRKGNWGEYVHTGDIVGVVMDTENGELSFAVNGVNLGVAFEGIPLDKPLVPCVLLGCDDDSVELII